MVKEITLALLLSLASTAYAQDYTIAMNEPHVFALCYENDVDSAVSCACAENYPLVLHICIGQIEANDQLIVYDGVDDTAPILYASIGTTDLSEIVVMSTGNMLTCQLISDGTNSCATDGYIPIVFSVNCAEAVGCDIGVSELAQQELELFPEPSDGLLTWRTPTALTGVSRSWVCDLAGRLVITETSQRMVGSTGTLDLRDLAPGQYVLHAEMPDSRYSRRFSIVR